MHIHMHIKIKQVRHTRTALEVSTNESLDMRTQMTKVTLYYGTKPTKRTWNAKPPTRSCVYVR